MATISGIMGSLELSADRVEIRFPDPLILRLIARSVLFAAALIFFPWLRAITTAVNLPVPFSGDLDTPTAPLLLLNALADMRRHGLLKPGDEVVFLEDYENLALYDSAVDFVFIADSELVSGFGLVDRALKVGGVVAVSLGERPISLPANYRIVYVRRFGSTIVALKKIAANAGRKLLKDETELVMMKFDENKIEELVKDNELKLIGEWISECKYELEKGLMRNSWNCWKIYEKIKDGEAEFDLQKWWVEEDQVGEYLSFFWSF